MPVGPAEIPDDFVTPAVAGLTPYEPGKPVEEVQRELGLDRVIKLASNEGPFAPFPAALEAMERTARELNRYPDGGAYRLRAALAERHDVEFEQVDRRLGRRRRHRLRLAGVARLGRRDRLRLAVVPELRDRRGQARRDPGARPAPRRHVRPRRAARRDHPTHEGRLRLQPEQPDGDDEHARRARRLLRAGPRARADGARPGVLRVHRRSRLPRRHRRRFRRGRRVLVLRTFSKIYGLAGLRVGYGVGSPNVVTAIGEGAARVRPQLARRRRRRSRASDDDRRGRTAPARSTRRHARASPRSSSGTGSSCVGPAVANFVYAESGRTDARPLFEALLRRGRDRPSARGLRRTERDPRHRRHTRGRTRSLDEALGRVRSSARA